eukprot:354542-Chlamydomonas_euryale.AAC.14
MTGLAVYVYRSRSAFATGLVAVPCSDQGHRCASALGGGTSNRPTICRCTASFARLPRSNRHADALACSRPTDSLGDFYLRSRLACARHVHAYGSRPRAAAEWYDDPHRISVIGSRPSLGMKCAKQWEIRELQGAGPTAVCVLKQSKKFKHGGRSGCVEGAAAVTEREPCQL